MPALPARLLVVLDPADSGRPGLLQALHDGGARWFWLRAKELPLAAQAAAVARFRQALPGPEVVLSLGSGCLAKAELPPAGGGEPLRGADGLHLPRDGDPAAARALLGPGVLLGLSAHDAGELAAAATGGADYATLGPLFPTSSKPGAPALGLAAFGRLAAGTGLPLLALGGIGPRETPAALAAGAAGVAVQGALMRAADPAAAARALLRSLPPG